MYQKLQNMCQFKRGVSGDRNILWRHSCLVPSGAPLALHGRRGPGLPRPRGVDPALQHGLEAAVAGLQTLPRVLERAVVRHAAGGADVGAGPGAVPQHAQPGQPRTQQTAILEFPNSNIHNIWRILPSMKTFVGIGKHHFRWRDQS